MMDWLLIIYTVSVAIQAGLFFVFSNTIMNVLRDYPLTEARKVMVNINNAIQNPLFLTIFLSPFIVIMISLLLMVVQPLLFNSWIIISFAIYFLGAFMVTIFFNVPMNNRLQSNENMEYWSQYLSQWTRWNHVRTISSIIALVIIVVLFVL
ncbi:DUF1772 domain-containing protein [Gracilibacillus phocaeensis]|uniref:anthrone oxygenase family protein n=1 Tax=Gracilibacillus phocaeensis TaxID=2042304 RepID=UPI0013EF55FF|nr:anthrone oxygenase family protein [Gracilibacillus phocaeensis]